MSLRVSVITAVRNRVDTIDAAMMSAGAQTWQNVEHIVIDGCSTDGTLAALERYKVDKLVSERDSGVYDALNKGIRHATGDIVGFLHSDDEFARPDALQKVAAAFADPDVSAVYGDLVYVSKANPGRVVRYWKAGAYSPPKLALGWMPPHPTFYLRRSVYERLGLFDTRFRISADYDHMLRVLTRGGVRPAYVPEVLVRMKAGGISNRSLFTMLQKSCEDLTAIRQNQLGGARALFLKNMSKLPQFILRSAVQAPLTPGSA